MSISKINNISLDSYCIVKPVAYGSCPNNTVFKAQSVQNSDYLDKSTLKLWSEDNLTTRKVNSRKFANRLAGLWENVKLWDNDEYKTVPNNGINTCGASKEDICLAQYSQAVAQDMNTAGQCLTGVKHAFWSAGITNNYNDIACGNAKDAKSYFKSNPDKFIRVECSKDELKNLPAGRIIVYENPNKDIPGHIAITNGNGQETSDCTDNMKWLEKEGDDAKFYVYKLSDNWKYDSDSKKLKFIKQN